MQLLSSSELRLNQKSLLPSSSSRRTTCSVANTSASLSFSCKATFEASCSRPGGRQVVLAAVGPMQLAGRSSSNVSSRQAAAVSVRRRSTSCCARRRKVEEEGPRRSRRKAQSQLQQQASPNDAPAPVSSRSKRSPRRSSRVRVADTQQQQQQQQQQQVGEELPAVLEDSRSQEASGVQSRELLLLEKLWQLAPVDNLSDPEGEGGQQQQQQHTGGPPAPASDQQLIPEPSPLPPPSGAWHPELQGLDDPGSKDKAVSNTVSHLLQLYYRLDEVLSRPAVEGVLEATRLLITQPPHVVRWLTAAPELRQACYQQVTQLNERKADIRARLQRLAQVAGDTPQTADTTLQGGSSSSNKQEALAPDSAAGDPDPGPPAQTTSRRKENYQERRQRRMQRSATSRQQEQHQQFPEPAQQPSVDDDAAAASLSELQRQLLALEQLQSW